MTCGDKMKEWLMEVVQLDCEREERKDLRLVRSILTPNYLNEENRSLMIVCSSTKEYIMFGGRLKLGSVFKASRYLGFMLGSSEKKR
jgi:hypothetical protein